MIKARMQVTGFAYSYYALTPHRPSGGPSCRRIRLRYPWGRNIITKIHGMLSKQYTNKSDSVVL